ncbi:MAG: hypothetical protein PF638_14125 [Candidatus Delongbacteria bacterium]|jgi:hypothetical protein|nr:hypothetical protein [Candidatus Delongbacteria bacterium]
MKKFLTLAVILLLAASYSMDITKHKVEAGADFSMGSYSAFYDMWAYDADIQVMNFTVPAVMYKFEAKPSDMFKLYLHGGLMYIMSQYTVDGETEATKDCYASALGIQLEPMGKFYLPNNLFVKVGLPFGYASMTDQDEDADAKPYMNLDMFANFGFDNREIDMHGLTPWNLFEKGMAFYGVFNMGVMESVDGDDTEELPMYFGVEGCYAYYADAMMVKPYLKYTYQLNEGSDTEPLAKDTKVNIGVDFVKDFNEKFNLQAGLDFEIEELEESRNDEGMYNYLMIDAVASYYVIPELDVYANLGMSMDLTSDDADPGIAFGLGAIYTFNLIKK